MFDIYMQHIHSCLEMLKFYIPVVGLGVALIFKISGRGIMEPDVPVPLATLTLVPSSRYFTPTLQGLLRDKSKQTK